MKKVVSMLSNFKFGFLVAGIFWFFSCSNSDITDKSFRFPLTVGNTWEYSYSFLVDYKDDEAAAEYDLHDELYTENYSSEITEMCDMWGLSGLYALKSEFDSRYDYYKQVGDSLVRYGYTNYKDYDDDVKKKNNKTYICYKGIRFDSIEEMTKTIRGMARGYAKSDTLCDPTLDMLYPLSKNKEWTYRIYAVDYGPWLVKKKVIGWENIDTPAGKLGCWKVQVFSNPDGLSEDWLDITYYQYYFEGGLAKENLYFPENIITTDEGVEITLSSTESEYILTNYDIK